MTVLFVTQWHEASIQFPIIHGENPDVGNHHWIKWGVRHTSKGPIELYYTSQPHVDNLVPLSKVTDAYWALYTRAFEMYLRTKEFVTIQETGGYNAGKNTDK